MPEKDVFTAVLKEVYTALYKLRDTYDAELTKERAHSQEVTKCRGRFEDLYLKWVARCIFLFCVCIIEACAILILMFAP